MIAPLSSLALRVGALVAGCLCAGFGLTMPSFAQPAATEETTYVVCITNQADNPIAAWFRPKPAAANELEGYSAAPGSTSCRRRRAAPADVSVSIALSDPFDFGGDPNRWIEAINAARAMPEACRVTGDVLRQADVERRLAVLLRLSAGPACTVSVGAAPAGATGLNSFETTRSGKPPVYFESSTRQSFPLCIKNEASREVAVWPRTRPALSEEFFPRDHVTRPSAMVWCSRHWLPPGSDVVVWLGGAGAREMPNSPDFTEACVIGPDLIAQARAAERQGVLVRVTRRRNELQCDAALAAAPERAIGLNAFNPPPAASVEN